MVGINTMQTVAIALKCRFKKDGCFSSFSACFIRFPPFLWKKDNCLMIDVRCLTVIIIDNCRLKVNSRLFLNCCIHNRHYENSCYIQQKTKKWWSFDCKKCRRVLQWFILFLGYFAKKQRLLGEKQLLFWMIGCKERAAGERKVFWSSNFSKMLARCGRVAHICEANRTCTMK